MFDIALKAGLPMIQATTDDLVYLPAVLKELSGRNVLEMQNPAVNGSNLYYTTDPKFATSGMYERLVKEETTLVLVNMEPTPLAFDAGIITVPDHMMGKFLEVLLSDANLANLLRPILRGLSLKTAKEVLMLTEARTGALKASEVRRTRSMVSPTAQGLTLMDTSLDFYEWPDKLKEWLDLNAPYFKGAKHQKLVPRGLLFDGPPGVGKSTAAKAIASSLGLPLFRLDIAATLDRYIGVSESRLAQSLALIDRESPCVLLIDEAEKTFSKGTDDTGVTSRMLSQLLWWLAEHQSRVFTVMTTNSLANVPPELYRPGRIDQVMKLNMLNGDQAVQFGVSVFLSVMGESSLDRIQTVKTAISKELQRHDYFLTHAAVTEIVLTVIKQQGWGIDKPEIA